MKNYCYLPYSTTQTDENNLTYLTYGIRLESDNPADVFEMEDISTDLAFVTHLAKILNENQVSSLHAADIIENLLVQLA